MATKMEAHILSTQTVFSKGRSYTIPPYQRPYTWEDEHVEQLILDINEACSSSSGEKYFIGSLICVEGDDGEYEVVDGQQRLITLTLIFSQLAEYLKGDSDAYAALRECYLRVRPFSPNRGLAPVVKVRKTEQSVYEDVLKKSPVQVKMTDGEKVFLNNQKSIKKCLDGVVGGDLVRGEAARNLAKYIFEKVEVVFLNVDDRRTSFKLFNVLNNRGIPLNDGDLLKSTLLECVSEYPSSADRVEDAWRQIEERVGERDVDAFLTIHQISEKRDRNRVTKSNYDYYVGVLHDSSRYAGDSVLMAEDLLKSARHYREILDSDKDAPDVTGHLARLKYHREWLPAFLAFFNRCDKGHDDVNAFPQLAEWLEKAYMHRWLDGMSAGQRAIPCYYAIEAINKGHLIGQVVSFVAKQCRNDAFKKALDNVLFYDPSRPKIINLAKCVLLRIEGAEHDDSYDGHKRELRNVTVEHVLPQSLKDPYWTSRFTEAQHAQWVHGLGNLTLLPPGKNSEARHLGFPEKKAAYEKANKKSGFALTRDVCKEKEWNLETIQKRHEMLKRRIINLWGTESSPKPQGDLLQDASSPSLPQTE